MRNRGKALYCQKLGRIKRRKKYHLLCVLIAAVAGVVVGGAIERASYSINTLQPPHGTINPEQEVTIQCDADTIIKAHYAEVVDAVREQQHYFNPAYDTPERKPI